MIRAALCDPAEVRHFLDAIKSPKTDCENKLDMDAMIAKGQTFKIVGPDGETVGAYVLAGFGPLLWVLAAGGRAPFDLSRAIFALIEQQGRQFEQVGFRTERAGLVRKAIKNGYAVTHAEGRAHYLRKSLNEHH